MTGQDRTVAERVGWGKGEYVKVRAPQSKVLPKSLVVVINFRVDGAKITTEVNRILSEINKNKSLVKFPGAGPEEEEEEWKNRPVQSAICSPVP